MERIGNLIIHRRSNHFGITRPDDDSIKDPFYLEAERKSERLLTRARELSATDKVRAGKFYEGARFVWGKLGGEHPNFFSEVGLQLTTIEQERYRRLGSKNF